MTTVVLADDDHLMRAGLVELLTADPDIHVLAEATTGREAVALAHRHIPDVTLMDVRMPDVDGLAATREIVDSGIPTRILILTTFEDDDYIFGAIKAGASGFMLKRTKPEELITAVHAVAAGDSLLSPSVTRKVLGRIATQASPTEADPRRAEQLTPREREVLALIAEGLSNREIAARLFVEESTIRTHVKRILMKLDLRDRIHAVIYYYESGLRHRT